MSVKPILKLLLLSVIGFCFFACNHQPKKNSPITIVKKDVQPTKKDTSGSTASFRNEDLKQEFKSFKILPLSDTIRIDINGDSIGDKVFFTSLNDVRKMLVYDGLSHITTSIGTDKSFSGMADDLSWVDFWGVINDKQTYQVIIKDDEIVGDKKVKLDQPSIFIRKDEVGGGIITFKKGRYIWIHQSD